MSYQFKYFTPTEVIFGKETEGKVGTLVQKYGGKKVLLHYGSGSVIRSGLLDRVKRSLEEANISYVELGGVVPNPHLSKVYEGIELGKKEGVDFILAVGGGSAIDSAKAISYGLADDIDVWDLFMGKARAKKAIPLGVILTIAAAGSEMSDGSVITDEKNGLKRAYGSELSKPKFAILNPELTMTLPDYQTSSGVADILMHLMERFFNLQENMELTDNLSVAIIKTIMKHSKILVNDPQNFESRAEIMWASSLAHNGLTSCGTGGGDWATHMIEHEVGGMFDVAHGAGLASIWGSWARYVHDFAPHRFLKFGKEVFGIENDGDDEATIEKIIQAMEHFYREINMPINLKELGVEPTDEQIRLMAASCEAAGGGSVGVVRPLKKEDITKIYEMARG